MRHSAQCPSVIAPYAGYSIRNLPTTRHNINLLCYQGGNTTASFVLVVALTVPGFEPIDSVAEVDY
jgi:hypothetical protein